MQQINSDMLAESDKLLTQIKNQTRINGIEKQKRTYRIAMFKKWSIRVLIAVVVICVMFFPVQTGLIIGTWIHDFFGNLLNAI